MATCLYKPKPCDICGKMIAVGAECEYVPETKGVRHYGCEPQEEKPGPESFRLADSLGFCPHDDASIIAMAGRWILWNMSQAVTGAATGRIESDPQGRLGILWQCPTSDTVSINDVRGKQEY